MEWAFLLENQYFLAALVLLGAVLLAKVFQYIFVKYLTHLTKKTETDIDDILLELASRPLFFLILLFGTYIAVRMIEGTTRYATIINGAFYVLIVLFVAWLLSRIFSFLVTRWFQARRGMSGTPQLLNVIIAVIIYLTGIIVILSHFQVEITPFIATLGIGGLAVGLALQGTLSNIFAGIHILSDQPVKVGDFVEVDNGTVSGHVVDISWRSTRIKTITNNIIIIPNAKLSESTITNYSLPQDNVSIALACGVDYGSDLEKVERIALNVANDLRKKLKEADKKFEPVVRFYNFGDNNVEFRIIIGASHPTERFVLVHHLMKAIHARFKKEKIDISWPIRKVYSMDAPKGKRAKR